MGCVEQNTGVSLTPDIAVQPFSEGLGNTCATVVKTACTWKESLAPAALEEASSAPLRARVNPVLHPWGRYSANVLEIRFRRSST